MKSNKELVLTKKKTKQTRNMAEKLNTLRAGVLGANDGILTVVGVLFSVAIATSNETTIFIAGLSDLLACAFSMASGEYASVSTQKDSEKIAVTKEQKLLKEKPTEELHIVQEYYIDRGVTAETSLAIANNLLKKAPLQTMLNVKYAFEEGHYTSPWSAAWTSLVSAASGGIFPLLVMTLVPINFKWPLTILTVCACVALTGYLSAKLGNGLTKIAVVRNVLVGIITMIIHYTVGYLL